MFRKQIIQRHINTEDIHHIISHHWSVFIKDIVRIFFILWILYVIYIVLSSLIQWDFLPWIFGGIGIIFFIKFIIDFLNLYLDGLILSSEGITLFMREGVTKYKTDFFAWHSIETVSHRQDSGWDKLFSKWDLTIRLEHEIEFPFENVLSPSKQVEKILQYKDKYTGDENENEKDQEQERISILSQALWEVVKEYLDKKWPKWQSEKSDDDIYLN